MAQQSNIDGLLKIFEINKKSILEKHCKKLTIYAKDFSNLINMAEDRKLNYYHKIYHREIVPNDLQSTLNTLPKIHIDKLSPVDTSNLLRKLAQVIKVRRQLVGHMFYNRDITQWRFFYFDQRDASEKGNRWDYGSHVHFMNYLWPNHDPVFILKEFLEDKPHFKGHLHIRFIEK
ncbi:MAG: hypothetical protein NTZ27_02375 [Ignavibacteriales bacterium]|nr:hypothetical protein [Ignavibacteriales bacterium]